MPIYFVVMKRLLLALGLLAVSSLQLAAQRTEPVVVYLVRHAERVDDSDDSPLSAAGEARARTLASMLRDAGLTHIHSTDYRRSRGTAAPVAVATGAGMELYDQNDIGALAAYVGGQRGRHLVIGHSNTLRETVGALGGEPGPEIAQDEYDRLYILTLTEGGTSTVLLRYGAPYRAPTG
jgi:broad specificity phosphatase PhoE